MHHPPHHPLRLASAEPATVTVAAAYEGAVLTTDFPQTSAVNCPDEGVRFGAYNGRVTSTNATDSTTTRTSAAAPAVSR